MNPFYNNCPSTPAAPRNPLQFKPLNSSPLVAPDTPKMSSPTTGAQARRRSQYKTQIPSTPSSAGRIFYTKLASAGNTPEAEGDPQKAFLRSRFKARCFERAVKAREKVIRGRRAGATSEPSSDDYAMDDDEEEDDEDIMQDELFRRIMANANEKKRHSYKVSYAYEVGSSFDPDLEDINSWEQELANAAAEPSASSSTADNRRPSNVPKTSLSTPARSSDMRLMMEKQDDHNIPEEFMVDNPDLDDDELEAYAEEWERAAAIADFEDIPPEDLFSWSDGEELSSTPTPGLSSNDAMDMS